MNLRWIKWAVVMALFVITINRASAQQFHQLTVNDFAGAPRVNTRGVVAYTNCTIDFKYQANRVNSGYILNAFVKLMLNTEKSWIDKSRITSTQILAEVINHEQGHYNIAYMEQQELLREIGKTRFSRNYQYEAMNMFNRIDAKYKQLNTDYDDDTQHMTNRVQQHSWDVYFQKQLRYMPPQEEPP
jgi:predicted secreted Zn-dependent protease